MVIYSGCTELAQDCYLTENRIALTRQAIQIQMQLIDRSMRITSTNEGDMVGEVMNRIIAELKDDLA